MGFDFLDQIRMERETVGTRPYTSIYDIETTDSTRMTVSYPPGTDATGGTTSFTLPHVDDIVADRLHLPPPLQFFTFTLGGYWGDGVRHDSNEYCYGVRPNNSHIIMAFPRNRQLRSCYFVNPDLPGVTAGLVDKGTGGFNAYNTNRTVSGYMYQQSSWPCLLYTSPSPRDRTRSRMPSSA